MRLTESNTAGENMYTPTSARSLFGVLGFSTRLTTRPLTSSATPNICGSGTRVNRICAAGASRVNSSTKAVIPLFSRLSPRYMTNESRPMKGSLIRTAWASPRGASCGMYVTRTPQAEPSPTAARISASVSPTTIPISLMPAATSDSMP
jgi:hypothetical protein